VEPPRKAEPARRPGPESVPQRRRTPVAPIPVVPANARQAVLSKRQVDEPAPAPPPQAEGGLSGGLGMLWVVLAVVVGVGLRFLHLPDFVVPILVGVGVGAVVVIGARYLLAQQPEREPEELSAPAPVSSGKSSPRRSGVKRRLATPAREASGN
jgi:hypothetical protein